MLEPLNTPEYVPPSHTTLTGQFSDLSSSLGSSSRKRFGLGGDALLGDVAIKFEDCQRGSL